MDNTLYKTTEELLQNLNSINSIDILERYLQELNKLNQHVSIAEYFEHLLKENKLNKSEIVRASHLDRTYAYQILQGNRIPSRNKLLALCLAFPLSLKETQYALTINGNSILYAKNKRDAIIIYAINTKQTVLNCNHQLYEKHFEIID